MLTRELSEMDRLIVSRLHDIRSIPFGVVVHIPRSGTIPAALIATHMARPLASVEEYRRGLVSTRKTEANVPLDRILLVDDSIRTGKQMLKNIALIKRDKPRTKIYTLSVYATRHSREIEPTIVLAEHDDSDYVYPWFAWKSKRIEGCAVDMDGVLCRDCTRDEDDDGERYAQFLAGAQVKFHTPHKIGAIITSRLERYRPQTEDWLARNGYQYGELIMGPWATKAERRGNVEPWKASVFRERPEWLYIESDDRAARAIAEMSGKHTWSVEMQMGYPR